jgi:ATP-dependent RNA helicase SUPV3L1/SUV3
LCRLHWGFELGHRAQDRLGGTVGESLAGRELVRRGAGWERGRAVLPAPLGLPPALAARIAALADRLAPHGLHLELLIAPAVLAALEPALAALPQVARRDLEAALESWVQRAMAPLAPLRKLEEGSRSAEGGPELRALLIRLVEAGGTLSKVGSGVELLSPAQRQLLRRLGVQVGALDLFMPAMLKPGPLAAWRTLQAAKGGAVAMPHPVMPPVLVSAGRTAPPPGYRALGKQAVRLDMAEKLLSSAHGVRSAKAGKPIVLDPALAVSMGLGTPAYAELLRLAGFQPIMPRPLPKDAFGPIAPPRWRWRPTRRETAVMTPRPAPGGGVFAALAGLVR